MFINDDEIVNITGLNGEKVRMKDKELVLSKIKKIKEGGSKKLQIITDFDRTVSKHHDNGKPTKSSYCVFEQIPTLPSKFTEGAQNLYNRFRVIEDDPNMSIAEKIPYMEEWWSLNEKLFIGLPYEPEKIAQAVIDSGVKLRYAANFFKAGCYSRSSLEEAGSMSGETLANKNLTTRSIPETNKVFCINSGRGNLKEYYLSHSFRDHAEECFKILNEKEIPVLVFSAGLGHVVTAILKHYNLLFDNMKVISNFFKIVDGNIVEFEGQPMNVYNKNQHAIENSDYFQSLSEKTNVLVMGDSLGDANMAEGVAEGGTILKIGFLSVNIDEFLPQYLELFDIVLLDDQTMDVFKGILKVVL